MTPAELTKRIGIHEDEDRANFKMIHEKLDMILMQTTKHNGRLTKLEKYMYLILGGLVVVGAVIAPLFLTIFKR